jgi:ketosteroid isomerase-like protein
MSNHQSDAEREVLHLGRRWAEAERRGDVESLDAVLASGFLLVGPLGFMLTKDAYLGSRRSGDLSHRSLVWDDVQVRVYGEAAVAVGTQTQESSYQGHDASGRFRVTQVVVRRPDGWRLAGLHYSPIAAPHPPGRPVGAGLAAREGRS